MWQETDWKGKKIEPKSKDLSVDIVNKYFRSIFQSNRVRIEEDDITHLLENNTTSVPALSREPDINELNLAILKLGSGTSIDGIDPELIKMLPHNVRRQILLLIQKVFNTSYPETWNHQLLVSLPKKGHKVQDPKLRGIGIGPALSRLYDIILNWRFSSWYIPNREQAGFREKQGCLLQIFLIYLLLDVAVLRQSDLIIAFLDDEKAFDLINRTTLIKDMLDKKLDKKLVDAFLNMYKSNTFYLPKIGCNKTGEEIDTQYGLTQGRSSSAKLFSFYVSDMPDKTHSPQNRSLIAQLADDTAIVAPSIDDLRLRLARLFEYSNNKSLFVNTEKTKILDLSINPVKTPVQISDNKYIEHVDKKGYTYLGITMIHSRSQQDHIRHNINKKKGNIAKFFAWIENNMYAPIKHKIHVLYTCVFPAILYGAETWWDFEPVYDELLQMERTAIKKCLGVKQSTPEDLLYIEINHTDIVSCMKDRQFSFFKKIYALNADEALVKQYIDTFYEESPMIQYYKHLDNENRKRSIEERKQRIFQSNKTMTKRYADLTKCEYNDAIYDWNMPERERITLTRWRLSCFDLAVETGRYKDVPRALRLCSRCKMVEDEFHVLFVCIVYTDIRRKYSNLVNEFKSVTELLHPKSVDTAKQVGRYLHLIEERRKTIV